jgi:hypothetical protein
MPPLDDCQVISCLGRLRIERHRLPKALLGRIKLLERPMRRAELIVEPGRGLRRNHILQQMNRVLEVPLCECPYGGLLPLDDRV